MAALRGRGMIRVLDARMLSRHPDGTMTETDLNPVIGEEPGSQYRPVAHLFGLNGHAEVNGDGNGNGMTPETFARTAGFAIEDLRRLTDEIPPASTRRWCSSSTSGPARCVAGSAPRTAC